MITANSSQYESVMERVMHTYDKVKNKLSKNPMISHDGLKMERQIGRTLQAKTPIAKAIGKMGDSSLEKAFNKGYVASIWAANKGLTAVKSTLFSIKPLYVAIAGILAGLYITSIINARIETNEFAKTIGDTGEAVSALHYAIKQQGGDIETLNSGLTSLVKLQADVNNGNLKAANIFERLGITIAEAAGLLPTELFKLTAERLLNIKDAGKQAALAVQIFGADAGKLLPLLNQGAGGIERAAEQARKLGLIVDDASVEELRRGKIALDNVKSAIEGVVLQIATKLGPYISTLIQFLVNWGIENIDIQNTFKNVGKVVGIVGAFIVNNFNEIKLAFMKAELKFKVFYLGVITGLNLMELGFQKFKDAMDEAMGIHGIKRKPEDNPLVKEIMDAVNAIAQLNADIAAMQGAKPVNPEDIEKWFENVGKNLKDMRGNVKQTAEAMKFALTNEALFTKGMNIFDETRTPWEKYNETLDELSVMLQRGVLDWDTYARAVTNATNALEDQLQLTNVSLPSATKRGSGAEVSGYNRARNEVDLKINENPQKRLERLQTSSLKVQERTEDNTKKMADALSRVVINKIGR